MNIDKLLNLQTNQVLDPTQIVVGILSSFLISLVIVYIYRKTHKGLTYSQSFVTTLVFITLVATVAMMVIGNNVARAFGLLGAFSIIRFRTVVKEPKDISYIFFALVEGMAIGTGSYLIAMISTVFFAIIILILHKFNFGSMHPNRYLLSFTVDSAGHKEDNLTPVFKKYLKSFKLLSVSSKNDGKQSEIVYDIDFLDDKMTTEFISEASSVDGVEKVRMITSTSDVEY